MKFRRYLDLIAFEHSIFALPFAFCGFIFAYRSGPLTVTTLGLRDLVVLIIVCAVSARTAAMSFNRIVDLRFDRVNLRTANRELVTGTVSKSAAWAMVIVSSGAFFLGSWGLGMHCLVLAPFVLGYLLLYSFSKRFTSFSHLLLGGALALAPGGAWWVLRPVVETPPLLLMTAVAFWVAGFDIIYSTQDEKFDRNAGLFSIPGAWGVPRALLIAKLAHAISFLFLILTGMSLQLPAIYYLGLLPIAVMFVYQHRLVTAADLTRVNRAFFTVNGWVGVYYLALVLLTTAHSSR